MAVAEFNRPSLTADLTMWQMRHSPAPVALSNAGYLDLLTLVGDAGELFACDPWWCPLFCAPSRASGAAPVRRPAAAAA